MTAPTITLYEANADAVYIGRNGQVWDLGPVTLDMAGRFADDAAAWTAGDWEPDDSNGQTPTSADGLTAVAEWTPQHGVRLLVDAWKLGVAGIYLGTEQTPASDGEDYDVIADMQRQQTIVDDARAAAEARGEHPPLSGMPGFQTWQQRALRAAGETYTIVHGEQVPLDDIPHPPATCDGASVGILIEGPKGLLVGDRTDGAGTAPPAGHVFDAHPGYMEAAAAEVREELGLTVTALVPVTNGWRFNRCKRGPAPDGRYGHRWRVYRATTTGTLNVDPASFRNVRYVNRHELADLVARTLGYATGSLTAGEWKARPGIEPVWARWLSAAGLVQIPANDLAAIELFIRREL